MLKITEKNQTNSNLKIIKMEVLFIGSKINKANHRIMYN